MFQRMCGFYEEFLSGQNLILTNKGEHNVGFLMKFWQAYSIGQS